MKKRLPSKEAENELLQLRPFWISRIIRYDIKKETLTLNLERRSHE